MNPTRRWKSSLGWYLTAVGALAVLVAGTFAFLQPPYPDPYRHRPLGSWTWFLYPLEWNAPLRLPWISTDLRSVTVREMKAQTETWVVGDGLFVARSRDGATWERIPLPEFVFPAAATVPKSLEPADSNVQGINLQRSVAKPDVPIPAGAAAVAPAPHKPSIKPRNLYDITFVDKQGWIVGDAGAIAHTTDGGNSWAWQTTPVDVILNAVRFNNDGLTGAAVGADGVILATMNGGQSWLRVEVGAIPVPAAAPAAAGTPAPSPSDTPVPDPPVSGSASDRKSQAKQDSGTSDLIKQSMDESKDGPAKSGDVPEKSARRCPPTMSPSEIRWQALAARGAGFVAVGSFESGNPPPYGPVYPGATLGGFIAIIDPDPSRRSYKVVPESLTLQITEPLNSVGFLDTSIGWATGSSSLFATYDGGKSWTQRRVSRRQGAWVGAAFANQLAGIVVESSLTPMIEKRSSLPIIIPISRVMRTEDEGQNWFVGRELVDWLGWTADVVATIDPDDVAMHVPFPQTTRQGLPRSDAVAFDSTGRGLGSSGVTDLSNAHWTLGKPGSPSRGSYPDSGDDGSTDDFNSMTRRRFRWGWITPITILWTNSPYHRMNESGSTVGVSRGCVIGGCRHLGSGWL